MRNLRETILIVEDDAQIRNFISFTLHSEDYAYETAPNGKTAMQMLVSRPIDLMLLDLGLPDVDGMDIIKKVREWSEIPIIVVSARDQDKEKALALDMGADDYLTKPFSRPSCWPASVWRCGICTSRAAAKPKPCFRWVSFSWTRKSAGCFSGGRRSMSHRWSTPC